MIDIDPNKPVVDVRSTVTGDRPSSVSADTGGGSTQQTAPISPADTGGSTQQTAAPISREGSSSSSTLKSSTSVPLATAIPERYTASSYEELIPQIEKRMAEYKPLSEEDLKKLRRRQRAEGIISGISDAAQSVANLIFTHHYAPNMYDARVGMSAKAKERFEKEKAEREAKDDKWFNYAITLGKLRDAEKERGLQAWQMEQNLARQDRAFEAGRKDREDDVTFRNKDYDERVRQWQAGFDRDQKWHEEEAERWERQFMESQRQFNVSSSLERQRIGLEAQRLAHSLKEGQMTFNLGSGGNVTLSLDKLNAQTISRIYHTLPDDVLYNKKRGEDGKETKEIDYDNPKVKGQQVVRNGAVSYGPPSTEAMLIAIGANVEKSPATQDAIRQVAGVSKPPGY